MAESPVFRMQGCSQICCLSYMFPAAVVAHVTNATNGGISYWLTLIAGAFFPGLATWYATDLSPVGKTLGREPKDHVSSCLEACFCTCCVLEQLNEALDECTRKKTELCGTADMRVKHEEYTMLPEESARSNVQVV